MVFDNLLVGYHGELKVSLFIIQGLYGWLSKLTQKGAIILTTTHIGIILPQKG